MIKKLKNIYPEEESIDGFSILCFETAQKLKKFSSITKNIQKLILNEVNKPKKSSIKENMSQISDHKPKAHNNFTSIFPTRVTTHRKSKPDMTTLTLAISCNKRRMTNNVLPTKNFELKIYLEKDDRFFDKENRKINYINNKEAVLVQRKEKVDEILTKKNLDKLCEEQSSVISMSNKNPENCEEAALKHTPVFSSSVILQPISSSENNVEFLTPNLSKEIDIDADISDLTSDSYLPKEDLDSTNNNLKNCESSEMINQELGIQRQKEESDEDDCMITSIGYDPAPKLSGIILASVRPLLSDIPALKPAPPPFFISSKASRLLQNSLSQSPPPPLIPAPPCYFSDLFVDNNIPNSNPSTVTDVAVITKTSKPNKSKRNRSTTQEIVSPRLKFHKRIINMKASNLKSQPITTNLSSLSLQCVTLSLASSSSSSLSSTVINATNQLVTSNILNTQHHHPSTVTSMTQQNNNENNVKCNSVQSENHLASSAAAPMINKQQMIMKNVNISGKRKIPKYVPGSSNHSENSKSYRYC